jgi:hypothetical protein
MVSRSEHHPGFSRVSEHGLMRRLRGTWMILHELGHILDPHTQAIILDSKNPRKWVEPMQPEADARAWLFAATVMGFITAARSCYPARTHDIDLTAEQLYPLCSCP